MFASVAALLAITVDRCIYIVKPLRYPLIVTKRRVFFTIWGVWLSACCFFVVFLVHFRKIDNRLRGLCYLDLEITPTAVIYTLISYFPLSLIVILNVWILIVAEKQRKRILLETATDTINVSQFFHAHKAVKTFAIIVAVLTLCVSIPAVVGAVLAKPSLCNDSCKLLWAVFNFEFYAINSVVNAYIYGMRHIEYRKAPGQIIFKILRCNKVITE
jgi:hypothetical protein